MFAVVFSVCFFDLATCIVLDVFFFFDGLDMNKMDAVHVSLFGDVYLRSFVCLESGVKLAISKNKHRIDFEQVDVVTLD